MCFPTRSQLILKTTLRYVLPAHISNLEIRTLRAVSMACQGHVAMKVMESGVKRMCVPFQSPHSAESTSQQRLEGETQRQR